jgi:hypothetical protein
VAGLLLFPSACADAARVHSLFDDPLAGSPSTQQTSALAAYAEQFGMSVAALRHHVAMGHVILPTDVTNDTAGTTQEAGTLNSCPAPPTYRNMPTTLMIDSAVAIVVDLDLHMIDAPVSRTANDLLVFQTPSEHLGDLEPPPPRWFD